MQADTLQNDRSQYQFSFFKQKAYRITPTYIEFIL